MSINTQRRIEIPYQPFAFALSTFFLITYLLCIIFGLVFPENWHEFRQLLEMFFPGFKWLSLGSFFIGLVETFLYGFYIAGVFIPILNYFCNKML